MGSEGIAPRPSRFTPYGRSPRADGIRGWVDTRDGLDAVARRKISVSCR